MKYLLIGLFFSPLWLFGQESQIRTVISDQIDCWNKGNLECYMEGYWKSDQLMFIGKSGVTYGWEATLTKYQKSYPNQAAMGALSLNVLEIYPLSDDYWHVVGRWALDRDAGDLQGHFSLIFRKINGNWLIVVDHSS
ncbi:MAG: nuclear transport factor 2 family protein [Marinoscillum sp.]